jgi:hypothetical protein
MNDDSDLLFAIRQSLAGVTMAAPLETAVRRGRVVRARRRAAILGVTAAIIVAAVALAVSGTVGGQSPPDRLAAWTVTDLPHGVIVVRITQLRDPAGLQRALRAHGVPAAVAFQGGTLSTTPPLPKACRETGLSPRADTRLQEQILDRTPGRPNPRALFHGRRTMALLIRPAAIPSGIGLNLTVQWSSQSSGWSLGLVRATPQCTGSR